MPMTDAQRQQKRRDKMRTAGYEQVPIWVRKDRKDIVKNLVHAINRVDSKIEIEDHIKHTPNGIDLRIRWTK